GHHRLGGVGGARRPARRLHLDGGGHRHRAAVDVPALARQRGRPAHPLRPACGAGPGRGGHPMSLAEVVAIVMFLGVVLYALFGGADFGAGLWDLTAGGPRRGGPTRVLIDDTLGPIWEANHVWL